MTVYVGKTKHDLTRNAGATIALTKETGAYYLYSLAAARNRRTKAPLTVLLLASNFFLYLSLYPNKQVC